MRLKEESKKFENFEAAVSLNFAYYNFCKVHGSIRMTRQWRRGLKRAFGQSDINVLAR